MGNPKEDLHREVERLVRAAAAAIAEAANVRLLKQAQDLLMRDVGTPANANEPPQASRPYTNRQLL